MNYSFLRISSVFFICVGLPLLCPAGEGAADSQIRITSVDLRPTILELGRSFEVHLTARAEGDVAIGSYVVRISHPIAESDAPPPFSLYRNNRAYLPENGSYNLPDNGELDIDPKEGAFGVEISTKGWREDTYYVTVFAHNRPAPGDHIVDHYNFSVTIEGQKVTLRHLGKEESGEISVKKVTVVSHISDVFYVFYNEGKNYDITSKIIDFRNFLVREEMNLDTLLRSIEKEKLYLESFDNSIAKRVIEYLTWLGEQLTMSAVAVNEMMRETKKLLMRRY